MKCCKLYDSDRNLKWMSVTKSRIKFTPIYFSDNKKISNVNLILQVTLASEVYGSPFVGARPSV
jgi:hypothetical protein